MVYIGSKYLEEADDAKRQEWIRAELEKVDAWRFDEAYIDNLDLADSALKAKLEDLDAADKLSYIERLKAREKIDNADVVSYLQKVMQSTPIVAGATILETGGFELTIDNIKIVVLPDVYNSPQVGTGGETEIQTSTFGGSPAWTSKNGVIDSLTPGVPVVPTVTATIQTHYASDAGPRTVSGYGVGTRPGDTTTEEKSLRHHEGAHGSEFIKSIQAAAPTSQYPVYTGRIGDPVGSFQTAERAYKAAVAKFTTMVDTALENQIQNVDCVGKTTIVEYHQKKGTTTKVTCNP